MLVRLSQRFRSPRLSRQFDGMRIGRRFGLITLSQRASDVPANAMVTSTNQPLISTLGAYLVAI